MPPGAHTAPSSRCTHGATRDAALPPSAAIATEVTVAPILDQAVGAAMRTKRRRRRSPESGTMANATSAARKARAVSKPPSQTAGSSS